MKTYIKPIAEIIPLCIKPILAGSPNTIFTKGTDEIQLSKRNTMLFDDEDMDGVTD